MQECKKCSNEFKWKDIIKSIWLEGYKPITCVNCNTKHYINFSAKLIISLSIFLPLLINNLINLFYKNIFDYFIIPYIIWTIIMVCVTPFYARYHIKINDDCNDGTKALLVSNLNNVEAEVIKSLLESYEIPYFNKSSGKGGSLEIFTGANNNGIDIYVQPHMFKIAKELIDPHNMDENQLDQ